MWRNAHAARPGKLRHFAELGDAADLGDRRLKIPYRARLDQRCELRRETEILPAGDIDTARFAHCAHTGEILRREERFFQPGQAVRFKCLAYLEGLR
jgi:hypothetical protein